MVLVFADIVNLHSRYHWEHLIIKSHLVIIPPAVCRAGWTVHRSLHDTIVRWRTLAGALQ